MNSLYTSLDRQENIRPPRKQPYHLQITTTSSIDISILLIHHYTCIDTAYRSLYMYQYCLYNVIMSPTWTIPQREDKVFFCEPSRSKIQSTVQITDGKSVPCIFLFPVQFCIPVTIKSGITSQHSEVKLFNLSIENEAAHTTQ